MSNWRDTLLEDIKRMHKSNSIKTPKQVMELFDREFSILTEEIKKIDPEWVQQKRTSDETAVYELRFRKLDLGVQKGEEGQEVILKWDEKIVAKVVMYGKYTRGYFYNEYKKQYANEPYYVDEHFTDKIFSEVYFSAVGYIK